MMVVDRRAEVEAEVGNTAIGPCGAPFLRPLQYQSTIPQASSSTDSAANVRQMT